MLENRSSKAPKRKIEEAYRPGDQLSSSEVRRCYIGDVCLQEVSPTNSSALTSYLKGVYSLKKLDEYHARLNKAEDINFHFCMTVLKERFNRVLLTYTLRELFDCQDDIGSRTFQKLIKDRIYAIQSDRVKNKADSTGTVCMAASIVIDGKVKYMTKDYFAGDRNPLNNYQIPFPSRRDPIDRQAEYKVSRNDADGQCLTDVNSKMQDYVRAGIIDRAKKIVIKISDSKGPCDGCKDRIDRFQLDVENLIEANLYEDEWILFKIETQYFSKELNKIRGNRNGKRGVYTSYGRASDPEIRPGVFRSISQGNVSGRISK